MKATPRELTGRQLRILMIKAIINYKVPRHQKLIYYYRNSQSEEFSRQSAILQSEYLARKVKREIDKLECSWNYQRFIRPCFAYKEFSIPDFLGSDPIVNSNTPPPFISS